MITITGDKYDQIKVMGLYHPWWGGTNPKFDEFSGFILDVKSKREKGQQYFIDNIIKKLTDDEFVICTVPSHSQTDFNDNGISFIARQIILRKSNIIDGTNCLIRHKTIQPAHMGGGRNQNIHLESIKVNKKEIIRNKDIFLMDDVITSGSSLLACKQLLVNASARNVQCFALGQTS